MILTSETTTQKSISCLNDKTIKDKYVLGGTQDTN